MQKENLIMIMIKKKNNNDHELTTKDSNTEGCKSCRSLKGKLGDLKIENWIKHKSENVKQFCNVQLSQVRNICINV